MCLEVRCGWFSRGLFSEAGDASWLGVVAVRGSRCGRRFVSCLSLIADAWGHGFVHIKLLGDLPVGSGALGEARKAASYLSKYVGKAFADTRVPGRNRYDVGQGFQPSITPVWGSSRSEAIREASARMGGRAPSYVWSSVQTDGWQGPPAVWVQWSG